MLDVQDERQPKTYQLGIDERIMSSTSIGSKSSTVRGSISEKIVRVVSTCMK